MELHTPPRLIEPAYRGWTCPACQEVFRADAVVCQCTRCGAPQHEACWGRERQCRAYDCRPETSAGASAAEMPAPGGKIVIRASEVRDVQVDSIPLAGAAGAPPLRLARYVKRETSTLALVALGVGLGALSFAGIALLTGKEHPWVVGAALVPGALSAILGGLALAGITQDRRLKGLPFALAALMCGVLSVGGLMAWVIARPMVGRGGLPPEHMGETVAMDRVPEAIRPAMMANVEIHGRRFSLGGAQWVGSGVIVAATEKDLVMVTNRHVIDIDFAERKDSSAGGETLEAHFFTGETQPLKVLWVAPKQVDLALVTCPRPKSEFHVTTLDIEKPIETSETVYAIGSPQGNSWSYTDGTISAIRTMDTSEGESMVVLQTQTPIHRGNSGGGLYRTGGGLVGINTWTLDPREAHGISYSISAETLAKLLKESGRWPL